jgi:electron transfer flavoprotein alpha/beta subunit
MAMGAKKGLLLSAAAFDWLNNSGIAGLFSAFVRRNCFDFILTGA